MTLREVLQSLLARVDEIESLKTSKAQAESDYHLMVQKLEEVKGKLAQQREYADHIIRNKTSTIEQLDKELVRVQGKADEANQRLAELEGRCGEASGRHQQILDSISSMRKWIREGAA